MKLSAWGHKETNHLLATKVRGSKTLKSDQDNGVLFVPIAIKLMAMTDLSPLLSAQKPPQSWFFLHWLQLMSCCRDMTHLQGQDLRAGPRARILKSLQDKVLKELK